MALRAGDAVGMAAGHDMEHALLEGGVGHRLRQPELMLPSRKLTLSRSISLLAFCTAVAASALVEVLDQQFDLAAENAVFGIDLVERELRADQFVLAERGDRCRSADYRDRS